MPPVKSSLGGNADIWDRDNAIGDGGVSAYETSKLYPIRDDAGDVSVAVQINSIIVDSTIVEMEENAGDLGSLALGVDYINLLGPIIEDAGDLESAVASVDYLKLNERFEEEAGDAEPTIESVDYLTLSVGIAIYVAGNEEDMEPAVSITEITLNA